MQKNMCRKELFYTHMLLLSLVNPGLIIRKDSHVRNEMHWVTRCEVSVGMWFRVESKLRSLFHEPLVSL